MRDSLSRFSRFVSALAARAETAEVEDLAGWAVSELSETLGFDCAWYGWAQLNADGVTVHANAALNLPGDYYDAWREIAADDLLAAGVWRNPGRAARYDRHGAEQTEGMIALADAYGLKRMATAMHDRRDGLPAFYLSGYRGGGAARPWAATELEFLQCAVDQVSTTMRARVAGASAGGVASVFVNEDGVGLLGLGNLRARLGALLPDLGDDRLPASLRQLIGQPGEHVMVDRNLVVTCYDAPDGLAGGQSDAGGMGLRRLTLRPLTGFDLLTRREREVARALAAGKSHKETARLLGVAPSTVRNQTQAIYGKLKVDNRSSLAAAVRRGVAHGAAARG